MIRTGEVEKTTSFARRRSQDRRGLRAVWFAGSIIFVVPGLFLHGQTTSERVIRAGENIPGIVVEESEVDPDLEPPESIRGVYDENRRAVDRPPRLLKTVPSQYPEELKGSGVVGEVIVSVMVDRMGRASHIRVEQSPDELITDAALDSLARWEFLPALRNSRITNSRVRVNIMVAEEVGESTYFDFAGGRITLEGVTYAGQQEHEVTRLFGLRPVYPFEMLVDAKPGEVLIEFSVGDEGEPYDMLVRESTHKEFSLAARAAMSYWRFSPAMQQGNTVTARMRYRVSFQPDEVPADLLALARRIHAGNTEDFVPQKDLGSAPIVTRSMQPVLAVGVADRTQRHRVTIAVVVTATGEALLPRIESAPDELVGYAAATVVPYWRFSPAYRNKQPVQVNVSLPVSF